MAIELDKNKLFSAEKTGTKIAPLSKRLEKISLFVLVVVVLISIFLWGWRVFIVARQTEALKKKITAQNLAQKTQELQKFVVLRNQIQSFKELLKRHIYSSQILSWLEANTHPQVDFEAFAADLSNNSLTLQARASSYRAVAEQLVILQKSEFVKSAATQSVQTTPRGVTFNIVLEIKNSLYQK